MPITTWPTSANPATDASTSSNGDAPGVWLPATVENTVPAKAFRVMVPAFSVAESMSIDPVTPITGMVVVIPTMLRPLSLASALNTRLPVPMSIVTPEFTLIVSALTVRSEFGTT